MVKKLLILLLISNLSVAQSGISVIVATQEGQPLPFASVAIKGLSVGALTDTLGHAELVLPYGNYTVSVSAVGYISQEKVFSLSPEIPQFRYQIELSETPYQLNEVVVSGTMKEVSKLASPVPVEVYSYRFFRANPAPSLFESLQNINGVRPQINCNICSTGDIHLNGLEGPYTMVLLDGMPIVSGLSTVYGLTGIPQALIERVEVVKGPASTLYGSEAVGGLVNIITKNPEKAARFSVDTFGTSWAELSTDLGWAFSAGKKVQGLVGINYFRFQRPTDKNHDNFTDLPLQNRISVFNKWQLKRRNGLPVSVMGRYLYENRWGGEMHWQPHHRGGDAVYGESIYTNRWESVANVPLTTALRLQLSGNAHHQNSAYGTTLFNARQYIGFGQLLWRSAATPNNEFLAGLGMRYVYYDDDTPATASAELNAPSITWLPGVFLQNEWKLTEQQTLLSSLRYDYNSLHGSILSPRLNYKWGKTNRAIRLSFGNGYRVANVFTEDHAALTGAREVVFKEELRPETSWNINLNATRQFITRNTAFIGLDASLFYTYFTNKIIPDYETNPNQIIYGNLAGYAVSKGVALNTDMAWQSGLKVTAGGTLQDVTNVTNGQRQRQLLTEHFSGVWTISYQFPKKNGVKIDYTGNVYSPMRLPLLSELDPRPAFSPWWSTQNIQVSKTFGKAELYGGIKNLLNFTPPTNSIARAFDPFDRGVTFNSDGQAMATPDNPYALTFDPTYVFAPNQGRRFFFGLRFAVTN